MQYIWHILISIEVYAILAMALNVQLGFGGLLNLAMGAFYGIGAYTYALFSLKAGLNFTTAIIIAISINVFFSFLISLAAMRFKGDVFVLISLAFQIITISLLWNLENVTGGVFGLAGINPPVILGFSINTLPRFFILGFIFLSIAILVISFLEHSAFGRTLQSIRDDYLACLSLGKNIVAFRIKSGALSSGLATFAGVLYATYLSYIDPSLFDLHTSVDIIFILILGGMANVRGGIIGAVIYIFLQEGLKSVGLPASIAFNLRVIIFGILIIILLYYRPLGLAGKLKFK